MSTPANLFTREWDFERGEQGLRAARVVRRAGGERIGGTLYELAPGAKGIPLHVHHANEELAVVIAGHPTLRTLDGERTLEPGEIIAFPIGRRGAHALENRTEAPVRYLMLSTQHRPEVVEYPEQGRIRAATRAPGDPPRPDEDPADRLSLLFDRSSAVEP